MTNIEKGIEIAIKTIDELPNEIFFEVRTIICLYNLKFWWKLEKSEQRQIGEEFKKMVFNNELKNVMWLETYSDNHNWYKKTDSSE